MAENDTPATPAASASDPPSRRARFIQGLRQNQGNFRSWMQQRQAIPGAPPVATQSPLAARAEAAKATLAARTGGAALPPPVAPGTAAPAAPSAPIAPAAAPAAPASPVVPAASAAPVAAPAAPAGPAVGTVEWLHSLAPDQQAKLASQVQGSSGANQLQNWRTVGNGTGSPASDAQIAMWLGDVVNSQQQAQTPSGQATAAYNAAQQQFTANNQLYGITGYQGNAQQVASQVAGGAQSAGIPMGVLGSSFNQGGADFGGQQNAGNSLNGNNGATNWNDPSVANYGVSNASYIPDLVKSLQSAKAGLASTPLTTGQVGNFVSSVPGIVQSPQFQQGTQAQQAQQQAAQYQATPAAQYAATGGPVTQNAQSTGQPGGAPVSYTASTSPTGGASTGQVGPGSQSASLASAIQAAQKPAQATQATAAATTAPTNANNASQNAQVSNALNAQQQQQTTQPVTQNAQRTTLAPHQASDQNAAQGATTKGVSQAAGGSSIITRGV